MPGRADCLDRDGLDNQATPGHQKAVAHAILTQELLAQRLRAPRRFNRFVETEIQGTVRAFVLQRQPAYDLRIARCDALSQQRLSCFLFQLCKRSADGEHRCIVQQALDGSLF